MADAGVAGESLGLTQGLVLSAGNAATGPGAAGGGGSVIFGVNPATVTAAPTNITYNAVSYSAPLINYVPNIIGTAPVGGVPRQATLSGFYVEPRLALPLAASNFTPYLYGRGGLLERAETISGDEYKSNVTQLGGGLGSMIYLAKGVQLNLTGGYQFLRAGKRIADDTRAEGGAFVMRAGLSLGGSSGWARDPGY